MLRHGLLSQIDKGLLIRRSWARKELNVTVLRAQHIANQYSIDVVLGDDGALELGEVEAVSNSRLIELSLVADSLDDVAHRVLGDCRSLRFCHLLLSIDTY